MKPHHFEGWFTSLAVTYDTDTNKVVFTPLVNTDDGIRLADDREKTEIFNAFAARNQRLLDGSWKAGWAEFCESMKDRYIEVIHNAFNETATDRKRGMFSHYLDCEAHTDVWRELFKTWNHTNEK